MTTSGRDSASVKSVQMLMAVVVAVALIAIVLMNGGENDYGQERLEGFSSQDLGEIILDKNDTYESRHLLTGTWIMTVVADGLPYDSMRVGCGQTCRVNPDGIKGFDLNANEMKTIPLPDDLRLKLTVVNEHQGDLYFLVGVGPNY